MTWLIGPHRRARNVFLLLASYFFYGQLGIGETWTQYNPTPLAALIFSTIVNYVMGHALSAAPKQKQKQWLWTGVGFNLGILGLFKYFNFFRESVEQAATILGLEAHIQILHLAFPIGISFYTFQAISYLVDLYRGHGIRATSFIDFALYQAFFPQILIGPICRSRDLLPQITARPRLKIPDVSKALLFLLSGLFKKTVIATLLDQDINNIFQSPESYDALGLWLGAFGYTIQLYCDFSGYTDFALGFALLLGFNLPNNFRGPYVATNLGEFWKRWHITFSRWLRDYIYLPLGGSRCHKWRISWNLFLTFLFCGFWHGASWGFILWGMAHGVAMAAHKQNRDRIRAKGGDPNGPQPLSKALTGWIYTFVFVTVSRIVFVASDLETAGVFYTRLFVIDSSEWAIQSNLIWCILIGLGINFWGHKIFSKADALIHKAENILNKTSRRRSKASQLLSIAYSMASVIMLMAVLIGILLLRDKGVAHYLYFSF